MRRLLESDIQAAVMEHHAQLGIPGTRIVAVPNEGKRSLGLGAKMKRMGLTPGFPDTIVFGPARGQVRFVELKRDDNDLSDEQKTMHVVLHAMGFEVATCWGREAPIRLLEHWGVVRRSLPAPLGGRIVWWAEQARAVA